MYKSAEDGNDFKEKGRIIKKEDGFWTTFHWPLQCNVEDKLFSFRLHPFGRPTIRGDKVTAGLRGWSKVQAAAILAGQRCSLCVTWIFLYLV